MDTLTLNTHELLEEAKEATFCYPSTAIAGNITALFAMLILQNLLAYEAATNPIENLTNIITIANSIAYLNTSIRAIAPSKIC